MPVYIACCLLDEFALFYAQLALAGFPDPVTSLIRFTSARTGSPQLNSFGFEEAARDKEAFVRRLIKHAI